MSIKYVLKELMWIMFTSFCFGFFLMLLVLLIRYPKELQPSHFLIIMPMVFGSGLALWQMISKYKYIKRYLLEKCYEINLD